MRQRCRYAPIARGRPPGAPACRLSGVVQPAAEHEVGVGLALELVNERQATLAPFLEREFGALGAAGLKLLLVGVLDLLIRALGQIRPELSDFFSHRVTSIGSASLEGRSWSDAHRLRKRRAFPLVRAGA